MRTLKLIAIGILLLTLLSACGTQPYTEAGFTTVTAGTIAPNDTIAPPSGPVVLSLTGKIGATNAAGRLDLDMDTLERVGLIEFAVDDPYLKRSVTYQGVLLKSLLD